MHLLQHLLKIFSIYLSISISIFVSIVLPICLFWYLIISLFVYVLIYLSIYESFYLLSIYLPIYPLLHRFIFMSNRSTKTIIKRWWNNRCLCAKLLLFLMYVRTHVNDTLWCSCGELTTKFCCCALCNPSYSHLLSLISNIHESPSYKFYQQGTENRATGQSYIISPVHMYSFSHFC